MEKQWYVLHTKSRHEHLAAEHLIRQAYDIYLPLIRVSKRRHGRWRKVTEPLFPSYLFIRVDLFNENTAPIRSTRGVVGIVRFGTEIPAVPEALISRLMSTTKSQEGGICQEYPFKPGDRVEIVGGPLAGVEAIFHSTSGRERAILLLGLLGRSNQVSVSCDELVPAL